MFNGEARYKLIRLDSVDSTNNYAKRLLAGDIDTAKYDGSADCAADAHGGEDPADAPAAAGAALPFVVVAEKQTAGRGRLGRNFVSPEGTGIYMSMVLPVDTSTIPLSLITPAAAVATCDAIKKVCNVSPSIKWVNDIYLNNKKICGILTEIQTVGSQAALDSLPTAAQTTPSSHTTQTLIIGIGVNCFPGSFPEEVAEIAGCISDEPSSFDKEELLTEIANSLLDLLSDAQEISGQEVDSREALVDGMTAPAEPGFLSQYRQLCFILGKTITVTSISSDEKYNATAVDIDRDGALIVERINDSGETETLRLVSAEVSLHLH